MTWQSNTQYLAIGVISMTQNLLWSSWGTRSSNTWVALPSSPIQYNHTAYWALSPRVQYKQDGDPNRPRWFPAFYLMFNILIQVTDSQALCIKRDLRYKDSILLNSTSQDTSFEKNKYGLKTHGLCRTKQKFIEQKVQTKQLKHTAKVV